MQARNGSAQKALNEPATVRKRCGGGGARGDDLDGRVAPPPAREGAPAGFDPRPSRGFPLSRSSGRGLSRLRAAATAHGDRSHAWWPGRHQMILDVLESVNEGDADRCRDLRCSPRGSRPVPVMSVQTLPTGQEHEKSELTSTRFVPWLRRPAERTQDAISYQ